MRWTGALHLSDVHFGHPNVAHRWDQALVVDALRKDIADHVSRGIPAPAAILVTGDIAFSGAAEQYASARSWLLDLAKLLALGPERVYLVPGNHDVDRSVEKTNRNAARILRALRDGPDDLDDALANTDDAPSSRSGWPLASPSPPVWPRRWSEKKKGFIADGENTPEERPFAEHVLPGLRVPVRG